MNTRRILATTICLILVGAISCGRVLGQTAPSAERSPADGDGESASPFSAAPVDQSPCAGCCDMGLGQSCCRGRWTASADFIILDRLGNAGQSLVTNYPPHLPLVPGTGVERLDSDDLNRGFAGGPRLGLIRHDDSGYDLELSYFQIDGWGSGASIAPNYVPGPVGPPPNWLVFMSPGGFVQLTDTPQQSMAWTYSTRLYNAELNVRWNPCCNLTTLAGFRWVNLKIFWER